MSAELAVVAVAAGLAVKACEKATELTVEAVWPKFLEQVQGMAVPEKWNSMLAGVGDRIKGNLPTEAQADPFNYPELLAKIVVEEQEDPVVGPMLNAVAEQLPRPPMFQQIGNRIQTGNIANDNAMIEFKGNVTQNFN
ncbi:MAG: hypothetical protein AAF889_05845 [Cyanobacteria bacterium P01_D01_bin.73]